MLQKTGARRGASPGFTLIELLIVVGILALMAFVATPWFFRISERNQLRSAGREIQTTLLAARMTAVRGNAPTSVRIMPAAPGVDHHSVQTWLEASPARKVAELELGRNVRFIALPPLDRVVYTSDGRRSPTAVAHQDIVLEGPATGARANRVTVEAWENGRVRLLPPAEWK